MAPPSLVGKEAASSAHRAVEGVPLYQLVADRVASMIQSGTLRSGDRAPSVRRLSKQLAVSISTVLQAYQRLESRGLLVPRPQSGFYVKPAWRPPAPEPPAITTSNNGPRKVTVAGLVMRLLHAAADEKVVSLGSADPADHCLPTQRLNRIQAALARRIRHGINAYDHPPGLLALRQQISRIMLDAGCQLRPDQLLTTCGCQEAIGLCLRAVAGPGDVIAIESPTYYGHLQIIESLGMRAIEVATHPRDGLDVAAMRQLLDTRKVAACLLVPNFNNPLGSLMPDANKASLVELLSRRDVPLIEDDIYGDLGADPVRPRACKAWDRDGGVLYCSSFSKTLTPGSRVGWCAPGRYVERVLLLKIATSLCTPTLAQRTLAEFLATGGYERHIRRIRRVYALQMEQYADAIGQYFPHGTCVSRPTGGFVLWVKLPNRADATEYTDRAMRRGIAVAPGTIFTAAGRCNDCIRITCSAPFDRRIDDALRTLGELARMR